MNINRKINYNCDTEEFEFSKEGESAKDMIENLSDDFVYSILDKSNIGIDFHKVLDNIDHNFSIKFLWIEYAGKMFKKHDNLKDWFDSIDYEKEDYTWLIHKVAVLLTNFFKVKSNEILETMYTEEE